MSNAPKIVIIAGPNGAGKTTFAREFLPHEANCPDFINADLIAAGLSPFAPESASLRAGRLMLEEIDYRVSRRKSFAFETTLSGRVYLHKHQGMAENWLPCEIDLFELAEHRCGGYKGCSSRRTRRP